MVLAFAGWRLAARVYGHTGTIPGCSGLAVFNPRSGDMIVILGDLSGFNVVELLEEFQRTLAR